MNCWHSFCTPIALEKHADRRMVNTHLNKNGCEIRTFMVYIIRKPKQEGVAYKFGKEQAQRKFNNTLKIDKRC